MTNRTEAKKDDRRTAGAVYVEFLIAFLPLFVMFMSLVQLAFVEVANLVTKNAAVTGARAAIVVLPDDPSFYEGVKAYQVSGKRKEAIEAAVRARLLAVSTDPAFEVRFPSSPGGDDSKSAYQRDDLVRVQVEFSYPCKIPIGSFFVCKSLELHKTLKAEAALPMQGAGFEW